MNYIVRFILSGLARLGFPKEILATITTGRFRTSARGFSLLLAEKVLRSLLGLFVGVWVLRYLGPTASGSIAFVLANISILTIVATLGLDSVVLRDVCLNADKRGALLGTVLALRVVCGIILMATIIGIVLVLRQDRTTILLTVILSSALSCQAFQVFELWFQANSQLEKPVAARVVSLVIMSGLRVGAILSGLGVFIFAAIQAADAWIANILNFLFFMRSRPFRLEFETARVAPLLRESWTYLLSSLAVVIYMRIDQIMLGTMLNKRAVGIFYAAVSLCEVLYFVPMALNVSLFPVLTRLKTENPVLYQRRVVQYCHFSTAYAFAISLVVCFAAPTIVSLLYGPGYAESTPVLRYYVFAFVFVASGVAQGVWFINNRRGDILLKKTIAGAITNIVLNIALIPRFGPVGAAWSTIAGQCVASYGANVLFDRQFNKALLSPVVSRPRSLDRAP